MTCRRCGEILNANANFCWSCGSPQHNETSPETIAVPVVAVHDVSHGQRGVPASPHGDILVIVGPVAMDEPFMLLDESTVGRHEESSLLLDDVSVSRHHAVFTRTASGRVTVRDLNSLNGTYVNGSRVEETTLRSADEIQIGKFKIVFWQATQ